MSADPPSRVSECDIIVTLYGHEGETAIDTATRLEEEAATARRRLTEIEIAARWVVIAKTPEALAAAMRELEATLNEMPTMRSPPPVLVEPVQDAQDDLDLFYQDRR